jgi:DNA polymerase (family 10)
MIINTDSHHKEQLDLMRYGVWNARRGWAEKSDIINTLPLQEFLKQLK